MYNGAQREKSGRLRRCSAYAQPLPPRVSAGLAQVAADAGWQNLVEEKSYQHQPPAFAKRTGLCMRREYHCQRKATIIVRAALPNAHTARR